MLPFDAMLRSQGVSSDRDYLTPAQFAMVAGMSEEEVLQKIETGRRVSEWHVIRKMALDFLTGDQVEIIYIPLKEAKRQYQSIRARTAAWWGQTIPDHFGRK